MRVDKGRGESGGSVDGVYFHSTKQIAKYLKITFRNQPLASPQFSEFLPGFPGARCKQLKVT